MIVRFYALPAPAPAIALLARAPAGRAPPPAGLTQCPSVI